MARNCNEFPAGLCVDCGMSVPGGDIICDECKSAWQVYSYTAGRDIRPGGPAIIQSGVQELYIQERMQLVPPEVSNDA